MSNLYWFKSFQREGKVLQRIMEKIVKASIQVTMSAISMTRFLDPDTTSNALLRLGNVEDSEPVELTQEPPTTTGKLAEDVAGRVETTRGPPNEL